MSQRDLNTKKIETLTKVARLLGDQIQAQSRAINKMQNEIDWIKESFRRITQEEIPIKTERNQTVEKIGPEIFQNMISPSITDSETNTLKIKKELTEKEELLQALRIIDNL